MSGFLSFVVEKRNGELTVQSSVDFGDLRGLFVPPEKTSIVDEPLLSFRFFFAPQCLCLCKNKKKM